MKDLDRPLWHRWLRLVSMVVVIALLLPVSSAPALAARARDDTTGLTGSVGLVSPLTEAPAVGEVIRHGQGYRFDQDGWIYLHLQGEARERGIQHGYLVAAELQEALRVVRFRLFWDTGHEWSEFVQVAEDLFVPKADTEWLDEIKGIAEGAQQAGVQITWQDVLAWNGYFELAEYHFPNPAADKEHCSAFIATGSYTQDGLVVMAHNSWDMYDHGQFANAILDIQPTQGHRMLMQSFVGRIHSGTDFFVTDAGLMGTETTIGGFEAYDPNGTPEFFRVRKAMQYADTLDDFVTIMLDGNNGGYANSWLLADADSGEILRLELGLKYHSIERTRDGFFIGFNAPTDIKLRALETDGAGYDDIRKPAGARRVRLTQLMKQYAGQINVDIAQQILADHYDVYLEQEKPGSRTIEGRYDLDRFEYWEGRTPYVPKGAVDGKVMDSAMAREMSFWARWGSSSGLPFYADDFLAAHPQYDYLEGYLHDRPTQPWSLFRAGQTAAHDARPAISDTGAGSIGVIMIGADDNGSEVQMVVGQMLEVVLESNPTTGYLWMVDSIDRAILRETGIWKFVLDGDPDADGAGGWASLRFRAFAVGKTELKLSNRPSWKPEAEALETFAVQVIVGRTQAD